MTGHGLARLLLGRGADKKNGQLNRLNRQNLVLFLAKKLAKIGVTGVKAKWMDAQEPRNVNHQLLFRLPLIFNDF